MPWRRPRVRLPSTPLDTGFWRYRRELGQVRKEAALTGAMSGGDQYPLTICLKRVGFTVRDEKSASAVEAKPMKVERPAMPTFGGGMAAMALPPGVFRKDTKPAN